VWQFIGRLFCLSGYQRPSAPSVPPKTPPVATSGSVVTSGPALARPHTNALGGGGAEFRRLYPQSDEGHESLWTRIL